MSDSPIPGFKLPPEQQALRDQCFHPSGIFVEFPMGDVEASIPERFAKIVRHDPGQLAIKSEHYRWSYRELDAAANRIARAVLAVPAGDAAAVGLICDNDAPLVAGMIGILQAGKAVLLLDPTLPNERIASMLDEAQAELVVCNAKNLDFAQELAADRYRLIDCDSLNHDDSDADCRPHVRADDLAFIFYTSGSTGAPKGVMQHHRTMLHNVMLRTNSGHICAQDRIALPRSGTSAAIANLLTAILNGATLYPFDFRKDGAHRLAQWLDQQAITLCTFSVPLFRSLDGVVKQPSFPHLRIVQVTSQAMRASDFALYKRCFSANSFLINRLSSSETGPLTEYVMSPETHFEGDTVPVGYPQKDKELLLFDSPESDVGHDTGELVVRSSYLSPGYWRRPDLTEAKFKADPSDPAKRLYYTGDLAQRLPDGCLVHQGRKDIRVKVRGYGVDILEVENALRDHPKVKEAVVAVLRNRQGDDVLVAYVTNSASSPAAPGELREFLKVRFADYMIPSRFVVLTSLPLTPNGKLDRQALPDPGTSRPELATPYTAPDTLVERELAQIWAGALILDQVGIDDNFFELGGDSLVASRVIARVIETFRLELPLRALFDAPTVAAMAAVITQNQARQASEAELAQMLRDLEAMTEEEAQRLVGDKTLKG